MKYYRPQDRTDGLDIGIQNAVKEAWETQVRMIYDRGYEDGVLDTEKVWKAKYEALKRNIQNISRSIDKL